MQLPLLCTVAAAIALVAFVSDGFVGDDVGIDVGVGAMELVPLL